MEIEARCPFCGEKEALKVLKHPIDISDFYAVKCLKCGCFGPLEVSEEEALEAWNRKAV